MIQPQNQEPTPSRFRIMPHSAFWRHRNANKIIFGTVGALLAIAILWFGFNFIKNRNVYARLGKQVVTIAQFNAARDAYKAYGEKTNNTSITNNLEGYTTEQVMLGMGLKGEADSRKIVIKKTDIDGELMARYVKLKEATGLTATPFDPAEADTPQTIPTGDLSPEATKGLNAEQLAAKYRDHVKKDYGWNDEQIDRIISTMWYQDKLRNDLIRNRDVLETFVRWDFKKDGQSKEDADAEAKKQIDEKFAPMFANKSNTETILTAVTFSSAKSLSENRKTFAAGDSNAAVLHDVNQVQDINQFQDQNIWNTINGLKKVGDYSPVMRSDSGFYYIMRLEKISDAKYDNWSDFAQKAQDKIATYSHGFNIKSIFTITSFLGFGRNKALASSEFQCPVTSAIPAKPTWQKLLGKVLGDKTAQAGACVIGNPSSWTGWTGTVKDQNGLPISNARITIIPDSVIDYCNPTAPRADWYADQNGSWATQQKYNCSIQWDAKVDTMSCGTQTVPLVSSGFNGQIYPAPVNVVFGSCSVASTVKGRITTSDSGGPTNPLGIGGLHVTYRYSVSGNPGNNAACVSNGLSQTAFEAGAVTDALGYYTFSNVPKNAIFCITPDVFDIGADNWASDNAILSSISVNTGGRKTHAPGDSFPSVPDTSVNNNTYQYQTVDYTCWATTANFNCPSSANINARSLNYVAGVSMYDTNLPGHGGSVIPQVQLQMQGSTVGTSGPWSALTDSASPIAADCPLNNVTCYDPGGFQRVTLTMSPSGGAYTCVKKSYVDTGSGEVLNASLYFGTDNGPGTTNAQSPWANMGTPGATGLYRLEATCSAGSYSVVVSAYVRIRTTPTATAPQHFYPWIQTTKGDVEVLGTILGQKDGDETHGTRSTAGYYTGELEDWKVTTALPANTQLQTSFVAQTPTTKYLYSLGGDTGNNAVTNNGYRAALNSSDGKVNGAWSGPLVMPGYAAETAPCVAGRRGAGQAVLNFGTNINYVYRIGGLAGPTGTPPNCYRKDVWMSTISNTDGTLSGWTHTADLPVSSFLAGSTTYNNYIYIVGGAKDGSNPQDTIYYAKPDSTSHLIPASGPGSWTLNATHLPQSRYPVTAVAYNGFLYVLGGNTSPYSNIVYYAPINGDGSVGAFNTTTSMPVGRAYNGAFAANNYIYIIGGQNGPDFQNDVYYATPNANGTIDSWNRQIDFIPGGGEASGGVAASQDYAYELGGVIANDPANAQKQVSVAKFVVGKEGTYVITAAMDSSPFGKSLLSIAAAGQAVSQFCSSNSNATTPTNYGSFLFGNRSNSVTNPVNDAVDTAPGCTSGIYSPNVNSEYLNTTAATDLVVAGIVKAKAFIATNPTNPPYKINGNLANNVTLPANINPTGSSTVVNAQHTVRVQVVAEHSAGIGFGLIADRIDVTTTSGTTTINDDITGNGNNQFDYASGSWGYVTPGGCYSLNRAAYPVGPSTSDCHHVHTQNSYYEFRFNGTGIAIHSFKFNDLGVVNVYVDGVLSQAGVVGGVGDLYSAAGSASAAFYTNNSLGTTAPAAGDLPGIWTMNAPGSGSTYTIQPSTVASGRATVYVPRPSPGTPARLNITDNIIYDYATNAPFTKINDVPNLGIIVDGDVYISKDVTQIDAAIYATGKIITCSAYKTGFPDQCRNRLIVHGGLFARSGFQLGRTYYNTITSAPAERIISNGQYLLFPPPGFDDRFSQQATRPYYFGELGPRF